MRDKKRFIFSENDLTKLIILVIIGAFLFGLSGVIIILFFHWITRNTFLVDESGKHGISQVNASRYGGLGVYFSILGILALGAINGLLDQEVMIPIYENAFTWFGVISCACLGLVEDYKTNYLTPRIRLFLELLIFGLIIACWPFLIPQNIGVPILEELLKIPFIGWLVTVVFCAGFVNSVNMADGANGLIAGMMTIAFGIFYVETGNFGHAAIFTSCALFTIFNVATGKLFLGDSGSYGLGAAALLGSLFLFSQDILSVWFLACLFSYPCIDFLASLIRRRISGKSVVLPDNDHLHNRIHFHFQRKLESKNLANSLTGIFILFCSSGLVGIAYLIEIISVLSDKWFWVFILQCTIYFSAFYYFGKAKPVKPLVVD